MRRNQDPIALLTSPGFLIGLGLLLLNDFLLKTTFHNWFTGKLSDFAGLFVFPLFFAAFFPTQKKWIYVFTAIGFVFWKSEFSQPFITLWNTQQYYHLDRVVDYTDLIALLVLPVSFLYVRQAHPREVKPLLVYVSCVIAVVAFAATSMARHRIQYTEDYQFDLTQTELIDRINKLSAIQYPGQATSDSAQKDFLFKSKNSLPIKFQIWHKDYSHSSDILIVPNRNGSQISLISIETREPKEPSEKRRTELRQTFEKEFIEELKKDSITKSTQIKNLWYRE
jgi:hypothetical protein